MSELVKALSTIAEINPPVSLAGLPEDYPVSFIGMVDVSETGRIINKHYRELKEVKIGFTRFQEGDVLFAKITPCMENGKGAIAFGLTNNIGFGSTEFHVLRSKKNIGHTGYIYQIIQSPDFRLKAEAKMTGSAGQKRVPQEFVGNYKVFIPSTLDEQHKIATILGTVDKVIEKTEAAIAKYKAIKAGMMQDMFIRGIDTKTGKLRPTFEEAPELYKESELGWIPKEWEAGKFGDICKVKAGYSFKSSEFGSNGYRLIRISNIQEYTVKNLENDVFITPYLSTQEYELKLGDLLIALSGATTGKVGLVKRESLPALLNQRVGLFEPQENTSNDYVYQIVSDESYQKSILDNCPSSAQPNVSPKYLEAIPIKYAKDQHEQALIVRLLKSIDSTIEIEYNQLKKSLKLKQGLMADLLTGKVRVNLNENKVENG